MATAKIRLATELATGRWYRVKCIDTNAGATAANNVVVCWGEVHRATDRRLYCGPELRFAWGEVSIATVPYTRAVRDALIAQAVTARRAGGAVVSRHGQRWVDHGTPLERARALEQQWQQWPLIAELAAILAEAGVAGCQPPTRTAVLAELMQLAEEADAGGHANQADQVLTIAARIEAAR